jgi:hypothetical protein
MKLNSSGNLNALLMKLNLKKMQNSLKLNYKQCALKIRLKEKTNQNLT